MTAGRRFDVASRVLAAVVGGYVATGLTAAALAGMLPLSRSEATHAATLMSFAIYVCIVLAVFHVSSARRAWMLICAIVLSAGLLSVSAGAIA